MADGRCVGGGSDGVLCPLSVQLRLKNDLLLSEKIRFALLDIHAAMLPNHD